MNTLLTIKLLHERLGHTKHRKVDGRSGKKYVFHWVDAVRAYCFTPANQAESDDLFTAQGKGSGAYFAPVVPVAAPEAAQKTAGGEVPPDVLLELVRFETELPKDRTDVAIANALLAAHVKGTARAERQQAHAVTTQTVTQPGGVLFPPAPVAASTVTTASQTVAPFPVQPPRKVKSPPSVPAPK